ncbi:MAG: hypothetical protein HY765_11140 [Rhodomicrobium sp.]|nr:hypothetical protein [Rhodomicrobium sp.]
MSFISDIDPLLPVSPLQAASRFDPYFDVYGLSLQQESDLQQRTVTLIARSPASPPAQALAMNLGRFQPLSVEVSIIFAQIAPANAMNFILQALSTACRHSPDTVIRWAKNRALLGAHERLTLGRTLCWTGDSMRRSEDSHSAIDRVDDGTPTIIAEANASFAALWAASKPLPKTLFSRGALPEAAGSSQPHAALVQGLAAGANVVRLDDYLRSRRH